MRPWKKLETWIEVGLYYGQGLVLKMSKSDPQFVAAGALVRAKSYSCYQCNWMSLRISAEPCKGKVKVKTVVSVNNNAFCDHDHGLLNPWWYCSRVEFKVSKAGHVTAVPNEDFDLLTESGIQSSTTTAKNGGTVPEGESICERLEDSFLWYWSSQM